MLLREEEKTKVNNSNVRYLEKNLKRIKEEEERLILEFDKKAKSILGEELYNLVVKTCGRSDHLLTSFHKSSILNSKYYDLYVEKVSKWFKDKTESLKKGITDKDKFEGIEPLIPESFALASLGLTVFHKNPGMRLYDVQKIAGLAIIEGNVAELGTGEGKTLSAVLPVYLQALRGKGAHVVTANSYLAKRDYEEVKPIFEGLGLSAGYVPSNLEKDANKKKRKAYSCDVTYAEKSEIAFDYLRDTIAESKDDLVCRRERGFALIDEVDDALIDDARSPYVIAGKELAFPYGKKYITLEELSAIIGVPSKEVVDTLKRLHYFKNRDFKEVDFDFNEASLVGEVFGVFLMQPQVVLRRTAARFYNGLTIQSLSVDENNRVRKILDKYPGLFQVKGRILRTNNNELYDLLTIDTEDDEEVSPLYSKISVSDVAFLRKTFGIVVNTINNKEKVYITQKTSDQFIEYVFLTDPRVNKLIIENQDIIRKELIRLYGNPSYMLKNGELTLTGFRMLMRDNSTFFKEHVKEIDHLFNRLANNSTVTLGIMLDYFKDSVEANEIFVKDKDYKVIEQDGEKIVAVLKNDRVLEGSRYANGIQEALEIKEGVPTHEENIRLASITQKDFYMLYDTFSGMTGTSSKKIFSQIYDKQTVSIPRSVYYDYYRKGSSEEPIGVDKKNTVFTMDKNTKFNLILKSIKDSMNKNPKEPVLLVVSDPTEIKELYEFLSGKLSRDDIEVLNSTTVNGNKQLEANIVAMAGRPGAITISTELAGRGTDIKLGGDRDTIINNAVINASNRMIAKGIKKDFSSKDLLLLKQVVEKELVKRGIIPTLEQELEERKKLRKSGLKVISSGFFDSERIDRQLEGRTGRNGQGGSTERFASLDDVIKVGVLNVGIKSTREFFEEGAKNPDGSIRFRNENKLVNRIKEIQSIRDNHISESIKYAQDVSAIYLKKQKDFVEQRFKLLELDPVKDKDTITNLTYDLLENTIDSVVTSYTDVDVTEDNVLRGLNTNSNNIDIDGLVLACKEYFGIDIDVEALKNTSFNLLEFRNALFDYTKRMHEEMLKTNPNQTELDLKALLITNKYILTNLPTLSTSTITQKSINSNNNYYNPILDFNHETERLRYGASKLGTRYLLGKFLVPREKEKLETIREDRFEESDKGNEQKETNNIDLIQKLRLIRDKLKREEKEKSSNRNSTNLRVKPVFFELAKNNKFVLKRKEYEMDRARKM